MLKTRRRTHRSTRVLWPAAVLAVAALALSACSGSEGADNEVTFVTAKGAVEWWPVQFGQELGIFEDEGLEVKTVQAKSGPEITSIVTSGSADVGMGVLEAAVTPIRQGAELSFLDIPGITPSTQVIVAPDVELPNADAGYPESVRDLGGLTIGITALGSPIERYLTTVLEDAGLSADDVTFVAVGAPPTALPAFTEGKVDALAAYNPLTQMLGEDAYKPVISAEEMVEHATGPASGVYYFAADDFAGSDQAGTFCSAIEKTYDAIKDPANEEAAVESLAAWTGLSPEQSAALFATFKESVGSAAMDEATWASAEEFLTTETPSYDDAVTSVCE